MYLIVGSAEILSAMSLSLRIVVFLALSAVSTAVIALPYLSIH